MTAVEWLVSKLNKNGFAKVVTDEEIEQAKEMERQDMENKAIHFAEWLTNKHTLTLMSLYEHFEEQFYTDEQRS